MTFQVTDRKAATTPKQILHRHAVDLDRAIRALHKNAKKNLKTDVQNYIQAQYDRLTDENETMPAELLFHDIEDKITNGVVEFKKTAPERLEVQIQVVRKESMLSCQKALKALSAEKAKAAEAKAEAAAQTVSQAKTDRISYGDVVSTKTQEVENA